jgi:hypothetical protein
MWQHGISSAVGAQAGNENRARKMEYLEASLIVTTERAEEQERRAQSAEASLASRDAALADSAAALDEVSACVCLAKYLAMLAIQFRSHVAEHVEAMKPGHCCLIEQRMAFMSV